MEKITIKEAAKLMNKSPQFIRVGLQTGKLPFGSAVKVKNRWNYVIYPNIFYQYVGRKKLQSDW